MVKASEKAKALSKEYNRIITQANHRLKRLEKGGWQESPAYKNIGGKKFSLKGKTAQQKANEVEKAKAFLEKETSTIKGNMRYLKRMDNVLHLGMKPRELKNHIGTFFKIAGEVKKRLEAQERIIYSSQRIFNAVSKHFTELEKVIDDEMSAEEKLNAILDEIQEIEPVTEGEEGFSSAFDSSDWDFLKH
jgi:hypothetical protein